MEGNKVSVRIFGQEYILTGDKPRDYMIRVAAYVDTKMHEVASGFQNGSATALAVLSAVNIADEYFSVMDRANESKITNEQMEGDIHRFEQLWEESKKSLAEHREESRRVYEEKEALSQRIHEMEREMAETLRKKENEYQEAIFEKELMIEELTKTQEMIDSNGEKDTTHQMDSDEGKYKDLENNIFDLQMENIQLKSEIEKLRSISE